MHIYAQSVDSCKLYAAYEVKVKALATVANSIPILLATWELFLAFGYVANR